MRATLARFWDGDLAWSWRHTPVAMVATFLLIALLVAAFGAPWIAPHNPFDLATIDLLDALKPPGGWLRARQSICWGRIAKGATCFRRSCMALRCPC